MENSQADMFDRVARRYELLNAACSLGLDHGWRQAAAAALEPRSGQHLLDAGCGTGDMIRCLRGRCPRCHVTGIDISPGMLALAARKLRKPLMDGRVELKRLDAAETRMDDAAFDGIVTAFCFRNLPDRPAALREFHRLLRPGGRLVILELTRPSLPLLAAGHRLYCRWVVPLLGRLAGNVEAYRYLDRSVAAFLAPREVLSLLNAAGFRAVAARALHGGIATVFAGEKPHST